MEGYVFAYLFSAPTQVRLSPNFVSHTLGHRGRGNQILEGQGHRSRSVGEVWVEVCALLCPSSVLLAIFFFILAKAREYVLPALVCLSVCLSVTTITKKVVDGFVPNFMGRFLGEREDQVRVSLRSVEGCGSNSQKTP